MCLIFKSLSHLSFPQWINLLKNSPDSSSNLLKSSLKMVQLIRQRNHKTSFVREVNNKMTPCEEVHNYGLFLVMKAFSLQCLPFYATFSQYIWVYLSLSLSFLIFATLISALRLLYYSYQFNGIHNLSYIYLTIYNISMFVSWT